MGIVAPVNDGSVSPASATTRFAPATSTWPMSDDHVYSAMPETQEQDWACCQPLCEQVAPPPPSDALPLDFAQKRWDEIDNFGCFSYRNEKLGCPCCKCCADGSYWKECTWCPNMWQSMTGPCCMFGKIVSFMHREESVCCGELCCGPKGIGACCCMCPFIACAGIPPGSPIQFHCVGALMTMVQRREIYKLYKLDQSKSRNSNLAPFQVFCCYCCSLWKQYVFISEMDGHVEEHHRPNEQVAQHPVPLL